MTDRWRPRIRLWHLFALVTLVAILVWLWPRLGLELDHKPGTGSRAAIVWNGDSVTLWNTFPPPATRKRRLINVVRQIDEELGARSQ
jgi:hypothetical protein